jgi:predicted metal-dependent hydrolase
MTAETEYDPRYLAGIDLFNRREFFEAHEVWEELWHATPGPERRFYQGLIQAAVAAYHAGNGNDRGARRLFHSGRKYMSAFPSHYQGLDIPAFWIAMEQALADFLSEATANSATLRVDLLPSIQLDPRPR